LDLWQSTNPLTNLIKIYNMNKRLKSLGLALLLSLPLATLAADVDWITDKRGCKVANIFPQEGESISWSGPCKDNFAHGQGKLTWYMKGVQKEVYEGNMVRGWAEGKGKLTRRDGVYTGDWKTACKTVKAAMNTRMAAGMRAHGPTGTRMAMARCARRTVVCSAAPGPTGNMKTNAHRRTRPDAQSAR
jgi:hypothetical protein